MNGLDDEEFCAEIELNAVNEGLTYNNPEAAVHLAFTRFQERRRAEEWETLEVFRKTLEANLRKRWRTK